MKQLITRLDDDLAAALKRRARGAGESVNAYVNRLLRAALSTASAGDAGESPRQLWKAAAIADGRLVDRPSRARGAHGANSWPLGAAARVTTPSGYAGQLISHERDDR